ncbi:phosphatidylethanolamine-binding protein 4 [Pseudophryne corroboree]|uniref:phosphatidylethanolamine-binding protein 4 n=1 Tax=Pseudophryne corroboree TaxID=495146 RepID=UPI00308171DD
MFKPWCLCICLLSLAPHFSACDESCTLQHITGDDAKFCSDDLHVVYPEIGDVSCLRIPSCLNYTQSLAKVWGPPVIKYSKAEKDKAYLLMMVDPDAPSRANAIRKYWRHWLVPDVQGQDLITGTSLRGRVLTAYSAPSPPANTGSHRYQVLLYLQPPESSPSLLLTENSLGSWDIDAFASRNRLDGPVVTTQFMAQNPRQKALSN